MQTVPSTSRHASPWEWVQAGMLAANLIWTTLSLGGYRPETMVVTSVLTGGLLLVHLAERVFASTPPPPPRAAGWWLLPFLVYAAANVLLVSPVRWLGWIDWIWWAQLTAVFWVVLNGVRSRGPRRMLFGTLVALALSGVVLACYQCFVDPQWLMLGRTQAGQFRGRGSGSFGIPNSLAGFLILILPAVAAGVFRRGSTSTQRVWWGWVTLVLLLGLGLTISRGAWLALALALILWPIFASTGGWRRRMILAVVSLGLVCVTGAAWLSLAPRVRERFGRMVEDGGELSRPILWRAGWNLFREQPLCGQGAGSYHVRFEQHRPERFPNEPQWAHNEYLNTLSDYGVLGAGLFFGGALAVALACARALRRFRRGSSGNLQDRTTVIALGMGGLAFALHLFVEFHLKIPALAMAAAIVAGLAVGRGGPVPVANGSRAGINRVLPGFAAAAVALIGWLIVWPAFRAEALRYPARQALDRFALSPNTGPEARILILDASAALRRAVAVNPANGQAWADLAHATSLLAWFEPGRSAELGRAAEAAADAALAHSQVCFEFWVRRGVARDLQGRWLEAGNDFIRALRVAPRNPLAWYYHADHLSRRKSERALALAALDFGLRLDPGNHASIALRQRLALIPHIPELPEP